MRRLGFELAHNLRDRNVRLIRHHQMDVVLVHFYCIDLEVAPRRYFKHLGFDLIAIGDKQLLAVFDGEYQMNEQEKLSVVFG
jgi:hypothetical protein